MSFALPLADALVHVGRPDLAKTAAAIDLAFESRDATFVSFVQSVIKNASSEVLALCEDHARFWGIGEQCTAAMTKLQAYQPEGIADQQFALVGTFGNATVRKYAAYDGPSTLDAANQFYDERTKYPLEWRKTASARLLGRADQHGVILPECVERALQKAAGLGWPTPDSIAHVLIQRLNSSATSEALTKLCAVFELMINDPMLRQDEHYVKQAVDVLAQFDTQYGLVDRYGHDVSLPEELLADSLTLQGLTKSASARQSCTLINGRIVDLAGLDREALGAVDPELLKLSQAELAEVLPTLPKGDADILARLTKTSAMASTVADNDAGYRDGMQSDAFGDAGPMGSNAPEPLSVEPATAPEPSAAPMEAAAPAAPMDLVAPVAPTAQAADPNTFTDATADAMAAAPQPDIMESGQPLAMTGPGAIKASYPGAGDMATAMNFNAQRAGTPLPYTTGSK